MINFNHLFPELDSDWKLSFSDNSINVFNQSTFTSYDSHVVSVKGLQICLLWFCLMQIAIFFCYRMCGLCQ